MRAAALLPLVAILLAGCTMPAAHVPAQPPPELVHPVDPTLLPRVEPWPGGGLPPRPIVLAPTPPGPAPPEPAPAFTSRDERVVGYNGGFEEGEEGAAAGWSFDGAASRDAEAAREGAAGLALVEGAGARQLVGGVPAGSAATLALHVRGDGGVRGALHALDAELHVLAAQEIELPPGLAWREAALPRLALPAGTLHLRVLLEGLGPGRTHVDDVRVRVATPTAAPFAEGGFENGAAAWRRAPGADLECGFSFAREGACALRLDHAGANASQRFSVDGGSLSLSLVHATKLTPFEERRLVAQLRFLDAAGAELGAVRHATPLDREGWVPLELGPLPLPAGAAVVELTLASGPRASGSTWVDDVRVAWS